MKKITILIVLGILCPFLNAIGQQKYSMPPLKIGDTLPDLTIQNVVNFRSNFIRLSDYKDKLLIINFWGIMCIPCVRHMPEIYALQKQFAKDVFFLPVDIDAKWDSPAKVIQFFKQRKKSFDLPSAVADTVLRNLFQPQYMGLYVWIRNGVVQQITDGEEVTASNIERALAGQQPALRQADRLTQDYTKPFFTEGNDGPLPSNFFMRSMLLPFSPTLGSGGWQADSTGNIYRVSFGSNALGLLIYANPQFNKFGNRIRISTKHSDLFRNDLSTDSLRRKYLFTYEAIFPPVPIQQAEQYVREDITRYLKYALDSVTVTDTCWVLKLSNKGKIKTGNFNKTRSTNIEDDLGLPIYLYNYPISFLRGILEDNYKTPVLDETGYKSNVWLDLPGDLKNTKLVAASLEKQGFTLTREIRFVQYLLIKDQPESK